MAPHVLIVEDEESLADPLAFQAALCDVVKRGANVSEAVVAYKLAQ